MLQCTLTQITLNDNDLRQGFGLWNASNVVKRLHEFAKPTFSHTTPDGPEIIDLGSVATIDKSKRNTTPLSLPASFGDIIHCDILYGSRTSITGYRYALYLIDKATRFKIEYDLKSLNDVLSTFKKFCADIGTIPKELRTDFDKKLMGRAMQVFMNDNNSVITSVPAGKQRANGICERS